jgi:uncharacterized protein
LTTRIACAAATLMAVVFAPSAAGAERRAYVLTETAGFHHDSIPAATALLESLGRRSPRYEVRFLAGSRRLTPRLLRRADAVVFLNTSGELPLRPAAKAALLRFVRGGGGLVGTHSATDTFHGWPDYIRMLGAEFDAHPFTGLGRVVVERRDHPATRSLPAAFQIREEFYFFRVDPRRRARVLARLDVSSFGGSTSEDRPLVWCRRSGRGRVFYDALGHFPEIWRSSAQRRLVAGGLAWALGLERDDCG